MNKVITLYDNKEINWDKCPGCDFVEHKFALTCGNIYEDDNFIIAQDWELPIPGFIVIATKKHKITLSELDEKEKIKLFLLADKIIQTLRKNNICDKYNLILEEKSHFHLWLMPREDWMLEITDNIINDIGKIRNYAKQNLKTEETYKQINQITTILRNELNK